MFLIKFIHEPAAKSEPREEGVTGLLRLGTYEERFLSHLINWRATDYSAHWENALRRVLQGRPAALVTDMLLPSQNSFLEWWPMWLVGPDVIFHNQLFFFRQHGIESDLARVDPLFELIGVRKVHSEDGMPISEWVVPASAIEKFLRDGVAVRH